jgi:hypothetical protein
MSYITINPSEFKVVDGDYLKESDLIDAIYEDGSVSSDDQWIEFDNNGTKVQVSFSIYASGKVYEDRGDYWTPPSSDVDITDIDITITEVLIDEYEVELTDEFKSILEKLVNKSI